MSTGTLEWPAHASHRCAEEVAEEVMEGADLRSGPAGPSRAWGLVPRAALSLPLIYVVPCPSCSHSLMDRALCPVGVVGAGGALRQAVGEEGCRLAPGWLFHVQCEGAPLSVCLWSSVSGACFEGLGKCRPSSALAATCKG